MTETSDGQDGKQTEFTYISGVSRSVESLLENSLTASTITEPVILSFGIVSREMSA
jgi:hypothetical protein